MGKVWIIFFTSEGDVSFSRASICSGSSVGGDMEAASSRSSISELGRSASSDDPDSVSWVGPGSGTAGSPAAGS